MCVLVREETRDPEATEELGGDDQGHIHGYLAPQFAQKACESAECIAVAKWWIPEDADARGEKERRLDGELQLPTSLVASFKFWKVGLQVRTLISAVY